MQKISSFTPVQRALTVLGVSLTILLSYNFMSAAPTHDATFTDAPANPPNNNVPAPINVGSAWQNKVGLLTSSSSIFADGNVAGDIVAAYSQVRSNQYCNAAGTKCYTAGSSGNESSYLSEPLLLDETTDLKAKGLPSNIVRVLINVSVAGGHTGSADTSETAYSGTVSYVVPYSGARVLLATGGDNGYYRGTALNWLGVENSIVNLKYQKTDISAKAYAVLLGYECQGQCQ